MDNIVQPLQQYSFEHSACALCGTRVFKGDVMFCSKCRVVVYCTKEHQVGHWKRHKKFCKDHVWRKDNPLGAAAAAACRVPSCACKKWYSTIAKPSLVDQVTNGHILPVPISSPQLVPLQIQSTSESTSFPEFMFSENGTLNFDGNQYETVIPGFNPKLDAQTVNTVHDLVKAKMNDTESIAFNNIISPCTISSGSPDGNGLMTLNQNALPSSSPILSPPLQHYKHPFEDSENHAPVAAAELNFINGDHNISQNVAQQANPLLWRQSHEQLTPGNISSTGFIAERTLQSRCNSAPLSASSSSSPSTSASLSGPSRAFVVGGSDNIEGESDSGLSAHSSNTIPFQHRNNMQCFSGQSVQQTRLWINQVWQQVIEDMNRYGVCVVDNLLGDVRGGAVLKEVQTMYSKGAFQDGQLVKGQDIQSRSIRGDKITWLDGKEPHCKNISVLIKLLDNIVMGANNRKNNGKLGTYKIKERSKAMVACYPGSGTHYVKHVDNPNDDGRCVTAIYYLNKDWSTQENGGLLRIFPEGWSHQVADIEPLFDRVIFFWSDRRNPHEVQPAYKTRYAITLWYFDSDAKARALKAAESNLKSS